MDIINILDQYFSGSSEKKGLDFSKMLGINSLSEIVIKRSKVAELAKFIGSTDEKLVRCQFGALLNYAARINKTGSFTQEELENRINTLVEELRASPRVTTYSPDDEGKGVVFASKPIDIRKLDVDKVTF